MRASRGFTLLELILVVLIFGIMSAMAYGGLNSVLKTRSLVEQSMDRTAEFQKAYLRLRNDLQNLAMRPARNNYGEAEPALMGSRDQVLQFTRGGWRNPLYLPRGSLERVVYSLKEKRLERHSFRVLDRAQDSEPVITPLLDGVEEIRWRYLARTKEWAEEWPGISQTGTPNPNEPPPLAVELTLVTKDLGELKFLFKPGAEPPPAGFSTQIPLEPPVNDGDGGDNNGDNNNDGENNGENDDKPPPANDG